MLALCPDTLTGKRDRALLALGFAGAFRRSELCALEVADLAETPDGLRVLIRRSKTDQEGQGQEVAIPRGYRLRPVEAVQTWLAAAEISTGPVFRPVLKGQRVQAVPLSPHSAAQIVKAYAERVGLDPGASPGTRCGRVCHAVVSRPMRQCSRSWSRPTSQRRYGHARATSTRQSLPGPQWSSVPVTCQMHAVHTDNAR